MHSAECFWIHFWIHFLNFTLTEQNYCNKMKIPKAPIVWHGAWFKHGYRLANSFFLAGERFFALSNGKGVFKNMEISKNCNF